MPAKGRSPLAAIACVLAISGCASSVSTAGFKGEQQQVAQTIANLQSDTSAQDQARVCSDDIAQSLVERLGGKQGCEKAIKTQQAEIDPGLEVKVESVHLGGTAAAPAAFADVKSTFEGKHRISTVELVKEGGKWKVSGVR